MVFMLLNNGNLPMVLNVISYHSLLSAQFWAANIFLADVKIKINVTKYKPFKPEGGEKYILLWPTTLCLKEYSKSLFTSV